MTFICKKPEKVEKMKLVFWDNEERHVAKSIIVDIMALGGGRCAL